jgi:hypothetical protein
MCATYRAWGQGTLHLACAQSVDCDLWYPLLADVAQAMQLMPAIMRMHLPLQAVPSWLCYP